ncbi:hypothetical protein V6N13_113352 [Hibiscus sabdariffa]
MSSFFSVDCEKWLLLIWHCRFWGSEFLPFSSNKEETKTLLLVFFWRSKMSNLPRSDSVQIKQVLEENLLDEIKFIRQIVDSFPLHCHGHRVPGHCRATSRRFQERIRLRNHERKR